MSINARGNVRFSFRHRGRELVILCTLYESVQLDWILRFAFFVFQIFNIKIILDLRCCFRMFVRHNIVSSKCWWLCHVNPQVLMYSSKLCSLEIILILSTFSDLFYLAGLYDNLPWSLVWLCSNPFELLLTLWRTVFIEKLFFFMTLRRSVADISLWKRYIRYCPSLKSRCLSDFVLNLIRWDDLIEISSISLRSFLFTIKDISWKCWLRLKLALILTLLSVGIWVLKVIMLHIVLLLRLWTQSKIACQ